MQDIKWTKDLAVVNEIEISTFCLACVKNFQHLELLEFVELLNKKYQKKVPLKMNYGNEIRLTPFTTQRSQQGAYMYIYTLCIPKYFGKDNEPIYRPTRRILLLLWPQIYSALIPRKANLEEHTNKHISTKFDERRSDFTDGKRKLGRTNNPVNW